MPPQTRRRISAPPDRVYSTPAPLIQKTFKPKKKRIKSYGKTAGAKVPKQETLTQMDYLMFQRLQDEEDEEESDVYQEEEARRKKKRRKTLGEAPSSDSKYHTQRLTQMKWSFSSGFGDEDEDDDEGLPNTPEAEQDQIYEDPAKSQQARQNRSGSTEGGNALKIGPPKTPKRNLPSEIPSTQSPATPISPFEYFERKQSPLIHKDGGKIMEARQADQSEKPTKTSAKWEALQPADNGRLPQTLAGRRPLQEKSINAAIPFGIHSKPKSASKQFPKLMIEDTFEKEMESQQTRFSSSPSERLSPAKSVKFTMSGCTIRAPGSPAIAVSPTIKKEPSQTQPHIPPTPSQPSIVKMEISDSEDDDEDDLDFEPQAEEDLPQSFRQESASQEILNEDEPSEEKVENEVDLAPETCYDEFGPETQINLQEAERLISCSSSDKVAPDEITSEEVNEDSRYSKSQYIESQRLSTQHEKAMGPRSYGSDAFVSVHPNTVTDIVNRSKNHYFRPHPLPPSVSRIWIYETKPACILKYMIAISDSIEPGGLQDETGMGNAEFNAGRSKVWKCAYEIRGLYELADPLPLSKLKSNEWLQEAPRKPELVKPAPLGHLMANLKPPLFTLSATTNKHSSLSSTDTQEVEAQLVNEFTQFQTPSIPSTSSQIATTPHTIHEKMTLIPLRDFPSSHPKTLIRPSQASTVDLTQPPTQTPRPQSRDSDIEIIFESPVRHCPSSTPLSLPTSHQGIPNDHGSDTLVPFSIASSQILTKSQLLPESLLTESVPPPPPFVSDSDDEDEDYL